jgi:SAM-dependent methyltransferase
MGILKDKARNYSQAFEGAGQLASESGRARKAEKIRAVLESEKVLPNQNLRLLDIGCAFGLILKRLAPHLDFAVGVDFDSTSMSGPGDRYVFVCADAERLPFSSGSFDIIICNHVYEHTDNPERMLDEIKRMLAPGGVCYFAGPNKYDFIEPHYGLPFLSWLPRPLADGYLRITGRGTRYVEKPYSCRDLKRLLARFVIEDYTGRIISDPESFHATDILPPGSLKQAIAKFVLKFMPFLVPGFVWVLRNPPDDTANDPAVFR